MSKDKRTKSKRKTRKNFQKQKQEKSLKKICHKWNKYLKRFTKFIESEDPRTLWTNSQRRSLANLLAKKITDKRMQRGKRHKLKNILVMVLYALLCGKTTYYEIAAWLKLKENEFTVMLGLEHGVPSASTLCRIFKDISFEELHEAFNEWAKKNIKVFKYDLKDRLELHLCADGKAIRALTKKHKGQKNPPYMLNAYLYSPKLEAGFCIASFPIDQKTNEAKALAPFLKRFVPKGAVVTIDAAGAYQDTTKAIQEVGAEALICLKGNQPKLQEAVLQGIKLSELNQDQMQEAIEAFYNETGYRQEPIELITKYSDDPVIQHGRLEERTYTCSQDLACIDTETWPQIQSIGCAERKRVLGVKENGTFITKGEAESTLHCYISTAKLNAKTMAGLIRGHWYIESRLHGILDGMAFFEDRSRMRVGDSMQNMAIMRRFAYNLLELMYLKILPEDRPSFRIRTIEMNESLFGLETTLFKKKACLPQI